MVYIHKNYWWEKGAGKQSTNNSYKYNECYRREGEIKMLKINTGILSFSVPTYWEHILETQH